MHEDMRKLLNAYLDNELHSTRLLEMQVHLTSCQACREELRELRRVSELLKGDPAPEFMPAERFAANLALRLPRRTLRDRPPKPGSLAWWLVPVGILGAFYFVRTVLAMSTVIGAADMAGLLGGAGEWLSAGQTALWFNAADSLLGGQMGGMEETMQVMNDISVLGGSVLGGFLWQAAIILAYWGWLAAWWLRRGPREMKVTVKALQTGN